MKHIIFVLFLIVLASSCNTMQQPYRGLSVSGQSIITYGDLIDSVVGKRYCVFNIRGCSGVGPCMVAIDNDSYYSVHTSDSYGKHIKTIYLPEHDADMTTMFNAWQLNKKIKRSNQWVSTMYFDFAMYDKYGKIIFECDQNAIFKEEKQKEFLNVCLKFTIPDLIWE